MALRLARAFTGRRRFIRFEGHYHGWYDNVLVGYHPGRAAQGKGDLPVITEGMSPSAGEEVIALPWNDLAVLEAALKQTPNEIAAIITEPILCNRCCLMPRPSYLEGVRRLATDHKVVLIFDEVITGFRVAPGGAQELFGVVPDLATFGKAVAGGFPLSVLAGKREIMELIERRRVLHAGTFNGNPVSLAAARATMDVLDAEDGSALKRVESNGHFLIQGLRDIAATAGIPILVNGVGSAFHVAFTTQQELLDYRDTLSCDLTARDQFLEAMLFRGIYLLPDGRWYVSTAHTDEDLQATLDAARDILMHWKSAPAADQV
jgi:glutamate-1-semialdehyde 2,1-aminomutase